MTNATWARRANNEQDTTDACPQCGARLKLDLPRRPGYRFSCPACNAWLTWAAIEWREEAAMGAPLCSACGSTMVKRQGKYGEFWGCSEYKAGCRGKPGQRQQIVKRIPTCELGLWREPDPELHAWFLHSMGRSDELHEREERREKMIDAAKRKARGWG